MGQDEVVDVSKMAISALLLILLVTAGMGLWYYFYDSNAVITQRWNQAVTTAAYDRLYDMEVSDKSVPATSVANALAEFPDDSIVFIAVHTRTGQCVVFYDNAALSTAASSVFSSIYTGTIVTPGHDATKSGSKYIDTAANFLIKNCSAYKCRVQKIDIDIDSSGHFQNGYSAIAYDIKLVED